jgi:hypothetical protein
MSGLDRFAETASGNGDLAERAEQKSKRASEPGTSALRLEPGFGNTRKRASLRAGVGRKRSNS